MKRRDLPLALLRIAIGWHFLYEGCSKLFQPGWTSAGYLKASTGPLAGFFQWLGSNGATGVIDQINIWGMILIGLGLMAGLYVRAAAYSGMALLALYYVAYPPFFAPLTHGIAEGSYLVVNKNLVELAALAVIAGFPVAFGLDALRRGPRAGRDHVLPAALGPIPRRELVANLAGLPFLGVFVLAVLKKHGWKSFEEAHLLSRPRPQDTFIASATVKTFNFSTIADLKGRLPYAKIGNVTLSRMILGGNLIGGWAHARDLVYVSSLVKAYHHRDKVFETFSLAERCGINTFLTNPLLCEIINDYWRNGGKIQFISDCGGQGNGQDMLQMVQRSIDYGACACYIQGGVADRLVQDQKFDLIAKGLDLIRRNKLPAGIGGHKLETVRTCVEKGLLPDFWMKTHHHVDYWSAKTQPENDNIWCDDPVATAAYMRQLKQPWIAYKVLAAGAIPPKAGFQHAFEAGADFICVGMYDFQIVEDINIALSVLRGPLVRERPWFA